MTDPLGAGDEIDGVEVLRAEEGEALGLEVVHGEFDAGRRKQRRAQDQLDDGLPNAGFRIGLTCVTCTVSGVKS